MKLEVLALFKDIGKDFQVDESLLKIFVDPDVPTNYSRWIYRLEDECFNCPYMKYLDLTGWANTSLRVKDKAATWRVLDQTVQHDGQSPVLETLNPSLIICDFRPNFGEFGQYELNINSENCELKIIEEPVEIYSSLILIAVLIAAIFALFRIYKLCTAANQTISISDGDNCVENTPKSSRILSLDVFRGLTITTMIFVNNGAGSYHILDHASWNGLHLADLVFPLFIWIMGVCIPISISVQIDKNKVSKWSVFKGILRRSIVLFLLGVMCNTVGWPTDSPDINQIRIMGVLQRFAITYLVVATLHLFLRFRATKHFHSPLLGSCKDILLLIIQWIVILCVIGTYTYTIFQYDVPGCGKAYFGPGGIHNNGSHFKCPGGLAVYLDRLIITDPHMYSKGLEIHAIFGSPKFEPENVLGSIPSILQVMLGVQAGYTLLAYKSHSARVIRWLIWAIVLAIMGGILCGFTINDGLIPINKQLWSLSYVLITTSIALVLFTFMYVIIDISKYWSGQPFLCAGMNSIVMYVGHMVGFNLFPFRWTYGPMNTHFLLTVQALWTTGCWLLVAYYLFKNKTFIKV